MNSRLQISNRTSEAKLKL